jgi:hypothetical protein
VIKTSIILLVSAIVFAVSFFLFSKAAGTLSLRKLNTVSYVFYVQIVLFAFVGSILVATGAADFHYLIEPVEDDTKIYAWLGVLYSMIAMPFAMILLNMSFNIRMKKKFQDYIEMPVMFRQGRVLSLVTLLLFALLSVAVLDYTFTHVEEVPLFTALEGDKKAAAVQRITVRREFKGIEHIPNLLGYLMMPIFAYYAAIYAFLKRKAIYWILFFFCFVTSSLFLLYDTQKAPVVFFLLGFAILNTLVNGGISLKRLILYSTISIVLLVAGYSLTTEKNPFQQVFDIKSALWSRVFITEYGGYVLSLEYFPDIIKEPTWHIGLPSFVLKYFGLSNIESARLLMMTVNPEGVQKGEANLVSSYYLGEAWANYGWAGLLLAPFIVGIVIQSVHIFLLKNPKEPLILSFYSYMTVRWLLNSGFVSFLYLKIILYPFLLYLLFQTLMKLLSNKKTQLKIQENNTSNYVN